jgi:hypothetical protein
MFSRWDGARLYINLIVMGRVCCGSLADSQDLRFGYDPSWPPLHCFSEGGTRNGMTCSRVKGGLGSDSGEM